MIAIIFYSYLFFVILICSKSVSTQPYQNLLNSQTVPVVQPINNNPYYQSPQVQTPTISPLSLQETINQLIFGITKANPSLQGYIEQNSKKVSQNAVEIPKTGSNEPRVINNFFIVPPEFFNKTNTLSKLSGLNNFNLKRKAHNKQEIDLDKVSVEKGGLKRRKNDAKRHKIQNNENAKAILEDAIGNNDKPKRKKKSKSRKTKERLVMAPDTEIISVDNLEVVSDEPIRKKKNGKSKRRKSKPKEVQNESIEVISEPILEENPEGETFEVVSERSNKKKTGPSKTKVTENLDNDDTYLKNIEEPVDNLDSCESKFDMLENRKTRNPKVDNQRRENTRKVNPIPDDILKAYFPYMNFYNPGNLPFDFEQYYQNSYPLRNLRNKKRRKNVKVVKPPNDTIEITIKSRSEPKIIETKDSKDLEYKEAVKDVKNTELPVLELPKKVQTSESIECFETVTDIPIALPHNINPKNDEVITKENYEILNENIEDLQNFLIPEIDIQPPVPVIYNNVIHDYYPVFYDESVYSHENDQAATTRNEERRYFYRTGSTEDARKHRKLENRYSEANYIEKDAEIFVPNQKNIERDNLRNKFKENPINLKFDPKILDRYTENHKIEDDAFQPPPFLENPDFTTKNVKEYVEYKDSNNYENKDKLSVYSDVKVDTLPDIKRVRIPAKNTRPKTEEIETISANSKVKTYGVQSEPNEFDKSTVSNQNNEFKGNSETTYVVAKSIGQVDEFYY